MAYNVGIVGAAGFAGAELLRLLLEHPSFEVRAVTSDALAGVPVSQVYPAFEGATDLSFVEHAQADFGSCDAVFLAVPHTAAMGMTPGLLAQGASVIDLSADFRLKDPAVFERWYKVPHAAVEELSRAAFGLPELAGDELAAAADRHARGEAVLVGCAGCYPTATSLAAAPALAAGLAADDGVIVADAVSGMTGAGKRATERTHFCSANENLEAYGVGTHRHTPEIEQILGIPGRLAFTPHLAPLGRGLLSTVNVPLAPAWADVSVEEVTERYRAFYADAPLVSVLAPGEMPKTASVAGTCRAHIGVGVHRTSGVLTAVCAIDNLGKGAAGQAIQCANKVFGLPETAGIGRVSLPV